MLKMVFLFLFIAVILFIVAWAKNKSRKDPVDFPYQSRGVLCSPAERSFMGALDKAVGTEYRVFAKVRLADVVEVKGTLSSSLWQSAFNRISAKHLDFVICHARDLSVVGTIELDDQSHLKKGAKKRDQFLEKALEAAEIPILRVKAQGTYSPKALSSDLDTAFNINVGARLEIDSDPPEAIQEAREKQIAEATDKSTAVTITPVCPKCGAELIERVAKKGPYAGQNFLGCSNFPKCKFARKIGHVKPTEPGLHS